MKSVILNITPYEDPKVKIELNFLPTYSTLWPPTAAAAAAWSLAFLASISSAHSSGAGVLGKGGGGGGGTTIEDNGLLPDDIDPQFQSYK